MSFPTFKVKSVATEEEANLTAKYELMRRKKEEKRLRLLKEAEGGGGASCASAAAEEPAPVEAPEAPAALEGGSLEGSAAAAAAAAQSAHLPPALRAASQVLQRTALPHAHTPAASKPVEAPKQERVLMSQDAVAALLAKRRGVGLGTSALLSTPSRANPACASPLPQQTTPECAQTPFAAGESPAALGSAAAAGGTTGSEKRPTMKRPSSVRAAPATAKKSRFAEGDKVSRMWDKVLKPPSEGEGGGAGGTPGAQSAQLQVTEAELHARRVYVSELPPNADRHELLNSMLRWGRVSETCVDSASQTGMVTFHDPEAAKRVVDASNKYQEGYGAPVLVAEQAVVIITSEQALAAGGQAASNLSALSTIFTSGLNAGLSKQDALNFKVKEAVEQYYGQGGPVPQMPAAPDRQLVNYGDI